MPQLPFSHFRLRFREGGAGAADQPAGLRQLRHRGEALPLVGRARGHLDLDLPDHQRARTAAPAPPAPPPSTRASKPARSTTPPGATRPSTCGSPAATANRTSPSSSSILPPGVVGKIAGVAQCPEAGIAQAHRPQRRSTADRKSSNDPSCPAASPDRHAPRPGAGVGSQLTYVARLASTSPAPTTATRSRSSRSPRRSPGPSTPARSWCAIALTLNPVTGEVEVDGAASDPIPHILKGIPLNVRDLRVHVDRPEFTLNATSCERRADPGDPVRRRHRAGADAPTPRSSLRARYQAADCASARLQAQARPEAEGRHQARQVPRPCTPSTPRGRATPTSHAPGARASPSREFIEQGHFRTICTRVQFAAGAGNGAAVPQGRRLRPRQGLDARCCAEPLKGPVYLRSSNHNLPDARLRPARPADRRSRPRGRGPHRLRPRRPAGDLRRLPRRPGEPGGRRTCRAARRACSSTRRNLCAGKHRAHANAKGQNGRKSLTKPLVRAQCKKAHKKRHKGHHKKKGAGKHKGGKR